MNLRRILANVGASALGLAVALALAEGVLRLAGVAYPAFYRVDAERGYGLRPGAEGWWTREGRGWVRINRTGFRGDDLAATPPAGTLRVAVLGDSFTEAFQVNEPQSWVHRLGDQLDRRPVCPLRRLHPAGVEVLNFGVGGYGTGQELLTWRQLVRPLRPQLVLLAVYLGNDLTDNTPEPRADRPVFRLDARGHLWVDESFRSRRTYRFRTSPPGQWLDGLMNHSRLLQLINEAKNRLAARRRAPQSVGQRAVPTTPQAPEVAWQVTSALLRQLDGEVRATGARLQVVSLTTPEQVWPRRDQRPADPLGQERRLGALLKDDGIPYLPLAPLLQRQADAGHLVLHGLPGQPAGDGHWNAEGHRLAGAAVADWLCPP
ncbi:MAG: SGNH/GDSL hydrolase family protein [Synechococcaceae cyanobacterium ELA445]